MADEEQLRGHLLEVASFAAEHLGDLEAFAGYWDEEASTFLRRRDKVAAEAILLAFLANRVPNKDTQLESAIANICDRAEEQINTGRNEALLRRFPQMTATLGVGFVLLINLGRRLPRIEALLRKALASGLAYLTERSTFRLMDSRWTYGLLDPLFQRPVEELLPYSTLGASPHPLYTMNEDDYAITHAIFYLTDFGQRPLAEEDAAGLASVLEPYLAWTAISGDLDLLGEFLMAGLCIRMPHSAAYRFAWDMYFRAWREGCLFGPEYSQAHFAKLGAQEGAAYAFGENYHTVFVGGILCATALSVPAAPTVPERSVPDSVSKLGARCIDAATRANVARDAPSEGIEIAMPIVDELPEWIVSRLMLTEGTPGKEPFWLRTAMEVDLSRKELCVPLYDALLVSAARRYDLALLAEALLMGAGHTFLRSSTFSKALDFLLVQQLGDGSVGVQGLLPRTRETPSTDASQPVIAEILLRLGTILQA